MNVGEFFPQRCYGGIEFITTTAPIPLFLIDAYQSLAASAPRLLFAWSLVCAPVHNNFLI